MNNSFPIEIKGLCKKFGKTIALDNIDLTIGTNTIIGLLGSNGCGKSTLIRHVIGLYLPDFGECLTFGCPAENLNGNLLAQIGYVHQEGQLLDWMSVRQHIDYIAAYYHTWNRQLQDRFVDQFEIDLKARVGALSPGKRQQLSILLAICHEPKLLLLDEPASALDPIARSNFLNLLLELIQHEGRTIIISSHILSDIEKVIDHAIIMDKGHILSNCSFDDLRERYCQVRLTGLNGSRPHLPFGNILDSHYEPGQAVITLYDTPAKRVKELADTLDCPYQIRSLTLEEIYKTEIERQKSIPV